MTNCIRCLFLLIALVMPVRGATITAASASRTDVNTAINTTAARYDTVVVPAGSASWTTAINVTKELTIIGAGIGNTVITGGGSNPLFTLSPDATCLANATQATAGIRIWGFTLNMNGSLTGIQVNGAGSSATKPFTNLFIGTNRFMNGSTTCSGSGAISTVGQVRGVIASNDFDRCNVVLKCMGNNSTTEYENSAFTNSYNSFGTGDQLFFEHNVIRNSSSYGGFCAGWIELGQGGRAVIRYNFENWANATAGSLEVWDIHGFQDWNPGQSGTMISEIYGNIVTNFPSFRTINHRGRMGWFHNNLFYGSGGSSIDASQNDAGCENDVPGDFLTAVFSTYVFNNTDDGAAEHMSINVGGCSIAENTSFWNFNASFNGTVGIGRGTSLPGGTPTDGVGFWVASTATPTVDPSVIQNGIFYRASGGSYVEFARAYDYPHPLRVEQTAPEITSATTVDATNGVAFSYQITTDVGATGYGASVPSPVAYWKLDEASGTRLDAFGTNHLGDNATVTQGAGAIENAAQFTAANSEFLSMPDNAELGFTTALSAVLRVKLDSNTGDMTALGKWVYSTDGGWVIGMTPNGLDLRVFVAASATDAGDNFADFTDANMTFGASFYHLAFVYDGSLSAGNRAKMYLNAAALTPTITGTIPASLVNDTAPLNLGKFGGGLNRYWDGRIDEAALFNRALTATEVEALYESTTNGLPQGLVIDHATGIISGTPTVDGTFVVTLLATNAVGFGMENLTFTIDPEQGGGEGVSGTPLAKRAARGVKVR